MDTGRNTVPLARLFSARRAIAASVILSAAAVLSADYSWSGMVSCATAAKPSEFAICNSEDLQVLDSMVDGAFKRRYAAAGNPFKMQGLSQTHEVWARERDICRADVACLERIFRARLNVLAAGEKQPAKPVTEFKRFTETAENNR